MDNLINAGFEKEGYVQVINNELNEFDNENSGFSLLINFEGKKILFDFGIGREVKENLLKIGLTEEDIDFFVLSHGHIDHTQGIKYLTLNEKKKFICHPRALEGKFFEGRSIGFPLTKEYLENHFGIICSKEPYEIIKDKVFFLGEIPRENLLNEKNFPGKLADGSIDFCIDDSAIALKTDKGILLIVGCSHSGIDNIINYSKGLFNNEKIYGILGGMHMLNLDSLRKVSSILEKENIANIFPTHCIINENKESFPLFQKRLKTFDKVYF